MIPALKNDEIVKKVGGRFKLAVLMQKRMIDVAFGAPILAEGTEGRTMMDSVVQEILQDKIELDLSGPSEGDQADEQTDDDEKEE